MSRRSADFDARRTAIVTLRAQTVCAACGRQPIDWHRKEHAEGVGQRIAYMVSHDYALANILAEIALCQPLCRSCHKRVDSGGTLTHCKRGHLRTPENTRVRKNGRKSCLTCLKEQSREQYDRSGWARQR